MKRKKKPYFLIFFTAFVIYGISFMIFMPPFVKCARYARDPQAWCYSNIRVIQGAVEMYNMDSSELMKEINYNHLYDGKYLKEEPKTPTKECRYLSDGDLSEEGMIYCKVHGGLSGNPEEIRRKEEREAYKKKLSLYLKPAIPTIAFLFIALL